MAKKNSDPMTDATKSAQVPTGADYPRRRRGGRGAGFLFLVLIAVSAYAYYLYQQNLDLKDPARQIARVVEGVSKHIIIPEGETPGVFAVDKSQNTEPFFKNAENGDWLIVYRSTNQAIIWSPKRNILVNAGVLIVNPQNQLIPPVKETPTATTSEIKEAPTTTEI